MTRIGSRFLLIGGYDGKSTFSDMWWLVSEEDPIAKRAVLSPANSFKNASPAGARTSPGQSPSGDSKNSGQGSPSPLHELRQRLGLPPVVVAPAPEMISDDKELLALGQALSENTGSSPGTTSILEAVRNHWKQSDAHSIQLRELSPLLRDYRRLLTKIQRSGILESWALNEEGTKLHIYRFYHLNDANQVRMDDIPALLAEYKQLLHLHGTMV